MSARVSSWLVLSGAIAGVACGGTARQDDSAAAAPRVEIVAPENGATFAAGDSVRVVLTVHRLTLAPAGTDQPGTGHHHILVNRALADTTVPIPTDSGFVHLGRAQAEHLLTGLAPGTYTVVAVLGDHLHVPIPGHVRDTVRFVIQ